MAMCTIFKHPNFDGPGHVLTKSVADFRTLSLGLPGENWNDEVSSIRIASGVWRFYEHINFQGTHCELGPGEYGSIWQHGIANDSISSAQLVSE